MSRKENSNGAYENGSGDLEGIRTILKDRGYLDGNLDKLFLGTILKGSSNLLVNIKLSLLAGFIGSFLLALPMAGAMVFQNPQLKNYPLDVAVLTVYFIVIFGIFITLMEFAAGLAVALFQKMFSRSSDTHGRVASRVAYPIVAIVFFYMIIWWRMAGEKSQLASVVAVFVALAASIMVGKLVSSASRAYSVRIAGADWDGAPGKISRLLILLLTVIMLGAGLVTAGAFLSAENARAAAEFTAGDRNLSTVVVGIDGLDYESFQYLVKHGDLPFMGGLARTGSIVPLTPIGEPVPPMVWTGMATGLTSEKHGIESFNARNYFGVKTPIQSGISPTDLLNSIIPGWKPGDIKPVSSLERKRPAFWEILSRSGRRCGVANWWATWPVTDCRGFVLSERTLPKITVGESYGGETCPAEIYGELLEQFGNWGGGAPGIEDIDDFYLEHAFHLEREFDPDCIAVYLPGLDILLNKMLSGLGTVKSIERGSGQLSRYCSELDYMLEKALTTRNERERVTLIVGDPGRAPTRGGSEGFILISGGPVRQGYIAGKHPSYSLAPLVLYLNGFPVARDMDGELPEEIFSDSFLKENPPAVIESYGVRDISDDLTGGSDFDEEMLENLKSLGYL